MKEDVSIFLGDCLDIMKSISDGSVDMILCDLPYGTTQCKWDAIIPFDALWSEYKRVIKHKGAIVLFGAEPFSSMLRTSNLPMFKYDIIWDKSVNPLPYTNFKYDLTVKVLRKLGVDVKKLEDELRQKISKDPRNQEKETKSAPRGRSRQRSKEGREIEKEEGIVPNEGTAPNTEGNVEKPSKEIIKEKK